MPKIIRMRRLAALAAAARDAHATQPAPDVPRHPFRRVCAQAGPGHVACQALVRTDVSARMGPMAAGAAPSGYGPPDLQSAYAMPSATACHILLVEADDNTTQNLGAAVDEAVALGAKYVSNSYAGTEDPAESGWDSSYYNHPGVVITAAAGDSGYGALYPAASPYVTSVGGTTLVADASTTRGWAESAWPGTGSGCSAYEPKPAWQVDAGCANRTTADVSAVADPDTGVAVYDTYESGGWSVFGGTSVATPLIASVYALAGAPRAGSYPAQYPYDAYLSGAGGLNDVTACANGTCASAYLCSAQPGYDGPTGLGTPDGVAAFVYHPHGTVAGAVTDSATGQPVAGAQVAAGGSLTQNIVLTGIPHKSVTGTVTAGSGQPWPLYATVSWSDNAGHGGSVFTTPATGRYSLSLLQNTSYTLQVTPLYPGYQPATEQVSVGSGPVTQNVALGVDLLACTAIGYHAILRGSTESFGSTSEPTGWQVVNTDLHYPGYAEWPGWVFDDPADRANTTGGSESFAIVDSDYDGHHHYQDTALSAPVADLSGDTSPVVQFDTDLAPAVNSTAAVQLSVDGGRTWATVWDKASFPGAPGPQTVVVPLPAAVGKAHVQVRFRYQGQWSDYWEIDNVFVGNRVCATESGGLIVGQVTDVGTGQGLDGASVTSVTDPREHALTVATPGDDAIGGGFYWLLAAGAGAQQFTVAMTGYASQTVTATVTPGQTTALNAALDLSP